MADGASSAVRMRGAGVQGTVRGFVSDVDALSAAVVITFAALVGAGLPTVIARLDAVSSLRHSQRIAVGVVMVLAGALGCGIGAVVVRLLRGSVVSYRLRSAGLAALFASVALIAAAFSHRGVVVGPASIGAALLAGVATPGVLHGVFRPARAATGARATWPWVVAAAVITLIAVLVGIIVAVRGLTSGADADALARDLVVLAVAGAALTAALEAAASAPVATATVSPASPDEPERGRAAGASRALLEVDRIDVAYGGVQVIFGASLRVGDGEAVALMGTNGAGKTTLLRAVSRLLPVSRGRILYDGQSVLRAPAETLARRGLVMVPGGQGVFPSLSVSENLRVAGYRLSTSEYRRALRTVQEAFPALARSPLRAAGLLSGGEQQMLALSRAYLAQARLLAIDELSMGLAPVVVDQLVAFTRTLRERGVSLLLVEQSVNIALALCDRAYFIERGRITYEGTTQELRERGDVLRSVLALEARPRATAAAGAA